jgi:hypothetical protein
LLRASLDASTPPPAPDPTTMKSKLCCCDMISSSWGVWL